MQTDPLCYSGPDNLPFIPIFLFAIRTLSFPHSSFPSLSLKLFISQYFVATFILSFFSLIGYFPGSFLFDFLFFQKQENEEQHQIDVCWENLAYSVTRLGDLLDFGQLFKACGNNKFAQISPIIRQFL